MTRSSLPLLHPKWVRVPVEHMPTARPRVPPPILRPARPHRGLVAWVAPDPVLVPVSPTALVQAAKMEWAVAAREAAPAPARESQLALDPVVAAAAAAPVAELAINPAEVVGTRSRLGGE
jgi:hypothetical protein